MNPLGFIRDIAKAVASIFGWIGKRQELNNSPEMQKRATAQKEVDQDNQDAKSIKNKDIDDIRNRLS